MSIHLPLALMTVTNPSPCLVAEPLQSYICTTVWSHSGYPDVKALAGQSDGPATPTRCGERAARSLRWRIVDPRIEDGQAACVPSPAPNGSSRSTPTLNTAARNGHNMLDAIIRTADSHPWIHAT